MLSIIIIIIIILHFKSIYPLRIQVTFSFLSKRQKKKGGGGGKQKKKLVRIG